MSDRREWYELIPCRHCKELPSTSVRGVRNAIEATVWCPNCSNEPMIVVPLKSRDFDDVLHACKEAARHWFEQNNYYDHGGGFNE